MTKVYVYPDDDVYDEPQPDKSDDYMIREKGYCDKCDSEIIPHYGEPIASCNCGTMEWYK